MAGKAFLFLLFFLAGWMAWAAWQPPVVAPTASSRPFALPERPGEAGALWRVVSRRMIVPKAADALGEMLRKRGLSPLSIRRRETVELHAFDDPHSFAERKAAVRVRDAWKKAGFEAELTLSDGKFGVALGRLYMAPYAQSLERRLKLSKRPYVYHRKELEIPTWRFTFAATPYAEAKRLWRRVQETGVADPVLMREARFRRMFPEFYDGQG